LRVLPRLPDLEEVRPPFLPHRGTPGARPPVAKVPR
jgi:hypothetical protein